VTEVEVTDPTHPLFGRQFLLRPLGRPAHGPTHVLVAYRGHMTLRLPLVSTNLMAPRPLTPTKLTREAITDLLALAAQCGALCPADPTTCGSASLPPCNTRSSTTSPRSSTR